MDKTKKLKECEWLMNYYAKKRLDLNLSEEQRIIAQKYHELYRKFYIKMYEQLKEESEEE